jgi:prepilin-type N-terminal cleavage/methylation domain-containing protein
MRRRAGVTLLELLLAVSLLGLLMAGILTALHPGVNAMGKANVRLMESRRLTGVQRILEQQIAGFMPVVATFRPDDGPCGRNRSSRASPRACASFPPTRWPEPGGATPRFWNFR